jgi:hypothetical protein
MRVGFVAKKLDGSAIASSQHTVAKCRVVKGGGSSFGK